jgi:hypothetical protein
MPGPKVPFRRPAPARREAETVPLPASVPERSVERTPAERTPVERTPVERTLVERTTASARPVLVFPDVMLRFVVRERVAGVDTYSLPGGEAVELKPGDVFFWGIHGSSECPYWDDCSGQHLYAVCPNGGWWDVDSRASNCSKKDDRKHRCWVRHGNPARGELDVDKNGGVTCAAGAGSIQCGNYHGFVQGFAFVRARR